MLALLGVIQLLRLPSVGECLLVYDSVSSSELCSPFLFETNRSSALAGTIEGLLLSYFSFSFWRNLCWKSVRQSSVLFLLKHQMLIANYKTKVKRERNPA